MYAHCLFKLARPCFSRLKIQVRHGVGSLHGSVRGPYFLCLKAVRGSVLVVYELPIAAVCAAVCAPVAVVRIPVLVAYKRSSCGAEVSRCD